jgi:hypothetical protein
MVSCKMSTHRWLDGWAFRNMGPAGLVGPRMNGSTPPCEPLDSRAIAWIAPIPAKADMQAVDARFGAKCPST